MEIGGVCRQVNIRSSRRGELVIRDLWCECSAVRVCIPGALYLSFRDGPNHVDSLTGQPVRIVRSGTNESRLMLGGLAIAVMDAGQDARFLTGVKILESLNNPG